MTASEEFHKHSLHCKKCKELPFGYCPKGWELLALSSKMREVSLQLNLFPKEDK